MSPSQWVRAPDESKYDIVVLLMAKFLNDRKRQGVLGDLWPDGSNLSRLVDVVTTLSPSFIYDTRLCWAVYCRGERGILIQ